MGNKAIIAIIVPIALGIIGIFAGGEATNWTFQIGDSTIITDSFNQVVNNYLTENNIDVEEFKSQCESGIHDNTDIEPLCRLV